MQLAFQKAGFAGKDLIVLVPPLSLCEQSASRSKSRMVATRFMPPAGR